MRNGFSRAFLRSPSALKGPVLMDGVASGCWRLWAEAVGSILVEVGGAVRHASQAPVNQWPARSEPSVWSAAWLLCFNTRLSK